MRGDARAMGIVHAAVAVTLAAILAAVDGAPMAGVYSTSVSPESASLASQLTHELAEAVADAAGDSKETADSEEGAEAGAAALWEDGAAESSGEGAGRSVGGEAAASAEVLDADAPVANSDLGAAGGAASVSQDEHSSETMSLVNDASDTDTHVMEIAIEPQADSSLEIENDSGDQKTGKSDSGRKGSIHGTYSLRDNGEIGSKQALTHDMKPAPDAAIKFDPVYDDHSVRDDDSRTKKRGEMHDSSAPLEVLVEKEKTMTSLIPLVSNNVMLGNDKMLSIIISEKPQERSRTNIASGKDEHVKDDDVRQDTSLTSKKALEKEDINNEEWIKSGEGALPNEDSFKSEESSAVDNLSGCDKNTTTRNKVEAHRNETGITTIHVHIKADRCSSANKDDDKTTSTHTTTTTHFSTTSYTTTTAKPYDTTTTTPYSTTTTTPYTTYTKTTTSPYTSTTTKSPSSRTVIASFIITYTPNPTSCRTNASNSNYPHSTTYPQISASHHSAAFSRTSSDKSKKASKMRKRRQDDEAVEQIRQPLATLRGTGRYDQEHQVQQDGADEFANSYLEKQPENLLEPYQRSMYDVDVPIKPISALLEMVGASKPLPALLDEDLEKSAPSHSAVRRSRLKTHVALPVRKPPDAADGTSGGGASGGETSAVGSSATGSSTMESSNVGIAKEGTSKAGSSDTETSNAGTSKAGAEGAKQGPEEPYLIDADGDHLVLVPNDATPGASPSSDQKHEYANSPDPLLSKLQRIEQMLHWERQNTLRDDAEGDADGSKTKHDQQRDEQGDHSVKFKGPVLIGEGVHRSESNSNNMKPSNDTKMNPSNFSTVNDQKKSTKEINNSFKFEDYKFENKTKNWGETNTANTKLSGSSSCKSSTSLSSTPACTTKNSEDSKVNLGKLSCGENCTFVQRTIIETVVGPGPDGRLTANSAIIVHNSFLSPPKKPESKSNSTKSKLCCTSKGRMPEMLPVASEDNLKKDPNVKQDGNDEDPEGTIFLGAPGTLQGRPQVENAGASGIIPKKIHPEGSDVEDEEDVVHRRPQGFATALQGDLLSKTRNGASQAADYSADGGGAPRMSSDGAKLSVLEMVNMKPQKVEDSGLTVNIIPGKRGNLQRHQKSSGPSYARVRMVKPDTGMLYGGDNGPHVAVSDGSPVMSRQPKTPEEQEQEGRRFPALRALPAGRLSPWEAPPHHHKRPHAPPSLLILPDDRLQMAEGADTPSRTLRRPAETVVL